MDLTNLLKDSPYIGALVVVVVVFVKYLQSLQTNQIANEAKRDQQWREFLTEQRTQTTAALQRLSAEITSVSNLVATVHAEQLRHDAWSREAIDAMRSKARRKPDQNTTAR